MERTSCVRSGMLEDSWESNNNIFEGGYSSDLSWAQKNYTCSFCNREFSSAQALGGHMNVHRRDRARLRQLPSWVFECPNPVSNSNTSPKISSSRPLSSLSTKFLSNRPYIHHYPLLSPSLSCLSSPSYRQKKSMVECAQCGPFSPQSENERRTSTRTVVGVGVKKGFPKKYELEVLRKGEAISLDLEMGCKDPKEVLDLELRLGCF